VGLLWCERESIARSGPGCDGTARKRSVARYTRYNRHFSMLEWPEGLLCAVDLSSGWHEQGCSYQRQRSSSGRLRGCTGSPGANFRLKEVERNPERDPQALQKLFRDRRCGAAALTVVVRLDR
jgi:hypothetical protein